MADGKEVVALCLKTVMSEVDDSVCDFREGRKYEAFIYGNERLHVSAHDGEVYSLPKEKWINLFKISE
jgi:hypothetical protein